MSRPALEVADVFRRHGDAWRAANAGHVSLAQRRVMTAIEVCRTAALGGHVERCEDCAHTRIAYNSCRNRHCPKCQWRAAERWMAARQAELLPVPYYHVVFTLPAALGAIAYQNKAKVYGLLFKAAAETLTTIAADPKHLGAEIGLTAVLHTWGQNLDHHPHVHCIVPGGGISPDGERWVGCRPGFFLPVRVLSRLFRRLFLEGLVALLRCRATTVLRDLAGARRAAASWPISRRCAKREWVVYAKRPFAGPSKSSPISRATRTVSPSATAGSSSYRRSCRLPLEGLSRQGDAAQGHAARRWRVHPPLPDARSAGRLPSHPPLRTVRQRASRREPGALPGAVWRNVGDDTTRTSQFEGGLNPKASQRSFAVLAVAAG